MSVLKRTLFLFLTLAFVLLPAAGAAETLYPGIDVSVWQGNIDFQRVKAAGKKIVYIRAGYGQDLDTHFRVNAQKARDAGLPIGFYFYVTAENAQQARAQARFFAQIIRNEAYQCRPAVDFEQYGSLSRAELNAIAIAFAETLEQESGHLPLFYTNVSSIRYIWDNELTRFPLWIAEYGVDRPSTTGGWGHWAGFQYGAGRVDGILTNVDLDWFTQEVLLFPFLDVPYDAWYRDALLTLYEKGIVRGTQDGHFSPNRSTTRAQAVTFLYRLAGEPEINTTLPFSDVPKGSWFHDAVEWAWSRGLTQGVTSDLFAPGHDITREDFALLLYRDRAIRGGDVSKRGDLSPFHDQDQLSPWAEEAVSWAVAEGLMKGTTPNTLAPRAPLPRSECVVLLERYSELQ